MVNIPLTVGAPSGPAGAPASTTFAIKYQRGALGKVTSDPELLGGGDGMVRFPLYQPTPLSNHSSFLEHTMFPLVGWVG
jgi:hypothetical protein